MKFKIFISVIIMMILLTGCVNNNQNMGEKDFNNNVSNQDENTNKTLETKKVNKGDSINLDFIEMNIESINIEEEIKIDTNRNLPIIIPKIEGNKYVTLRGNLKNLYTEEIIFQDNLYGNLVVNDKYKYSLSISTGYQVSPLEESNFVIYASVPISVAETLYDYNNKFKFSFEENFEFNLEAYNDYTIAKHQYELEF